MYEDDYNVDDEGYAIPSDSSEYSNKRAMAYNNTRNEPVGHYTGRCRFCGSKNLWEDNLHYGCNTCGRYLGG